MQPLGQGGTDDISNLVLCCKPCNEVKDDMTVAEYCEFVAYVGGFGEVKRLAVGGLYRHIPRVALSL